MLSTHSQVLLPTNEVPPPQPMRSEMLLARLQQSSKQQQLYQQMPKLGSLTPSAPAAAPSPAISRGAAALQLSPASAAAAVVPPSPPPLAAPAPAGNLPIRAAPPVELQFRPEPEAVLPASAAPAGIMPETQDTVVAASVVAAAATPEAAQPDHAVPVSPARPGSAPVDAQQLPPEFLPTQHADRADAAAGAAHAAQEPADAGRGNADSKPVQQAASDPPAPGGESEAGVADFMASEVVASQQPAATSPVTQAAECAAMQPQSTEVQPAADPPSAVTEPQAAESVPALLPTTELATESETAAASGPSQDPASAAANDDAAASVPATQLASELQAALPASAPDAAATSLPPGPADATIEVPMDYAIGIPIILSSGDDEQQPIAAEIPQTQAPAASPKPSSEPPPEAHSPPAAPQPRCAAAAARADNDDGLSSSYSGFLSAQENGGSEASGSVYTDANTFAQSSDAFGSTADQGPVAGDTQQDATALLPLANADEQQAEGPADSGVTDRQSPAATPTAAATAADYMGAGHGEAAPPLASQPAQQLAEPSLSSQQAAGTANTAAAAEPSAAAPATGGAALSADYAAGAAPEPAAAQPDAADSDPGFVPLPDALEDSDADGEPGTGAAPARICADSEEPAAGAAQPEHSETPPAELHPSHRRAAPRKSLRHARGAESCSLLHAYNCCCSGLVVTHSWYSACQAQT